MFSAYSLSLFTILGNAIAAPCPNASEPKIRAACGELNVFYTGFTAFHPWVADIGVIPEDVDKALRWGAADLTKAGFNVQVVFQGPEQPISNFATRMEGKEWAFGAVGYGLRGFRNGTATAEFEDILILFNKLAPNATAVFNWGTDSFGEAITRRVELTEDCANKPGKLLGYEEICDPSVCKKTTQVLDGDLSKLTYDRK